MRLIKKLSEEIKDEMQDVKKYVHLALQYKQSDEDAYNVYMQLAGEEYDHATRLHNLAVQEINKQKKKLAERGEQIPAIMLELWQDEHTQYVNDMAILKHEIDIAKR